MLDVDELRDGQRDVVVASLPRTVEEHHLGKAGRVGTHLIALAERRLGRHWFERSGVTESRGHRRRNGLDRCQLTRAAAQPVTGRLAAVTARARNHADAHQGQQRHLASPIHSTLRLRPRTRTHCSPPVSMPTATTLLAGCPSRLVTSVTRLATSKVVRA